MRIPLSVPHVTTSQNSLVFSDPLIEVSDTGQNFSQTRHRTSAGRSQDPAINPVGRRASGWSSKQMR
jgi:hypothetical protein